MSNASKAEGRRQSAPQHEPPSQGWSRREFLAQVGKGSAIATLATHAPQSWSLPAAQAETAPTKSPDELTYVSATALAKAIREKKVSAHEVVTAYLRRIEAVNPKLNAIVQLTADSARAQAREADAALARGESKGPLHGVPMTVKDLFETAGVVCAAGTKGRAAFVPKQDATIVARLRAAGAILLGKTNVPELGIAPETDNLVYGRTNNPYDLKRTPGGSSGGEAAIIAAGGSPLGVGSDFGGSIRLPAHFCGIVGIKPTSGSAPRTGHFPGPGGPFDTMLQVGPMARFVEDLSLTLPLLIGPDGRDVAVAPVPWRDPKTVELKTLRVAFHTDNGIISPTPETVAVVQTTAKALSQAKMVVEEARPQEIEQGYELLVGLIGADSGTGMQTLLQLLGTTEVSPFMQRYLRLIRFQALSINTFMDLLYQWSLWRSAMLLFLDKYDVILCPVCAYPALPHGGTLNLGKYPAALSYTNLYNFAGWPGAVVRGGTSPEGLPIGVQIVAGPWREDVVLAVAQHIETALGGWQQPSI